MKERILKLLQDTMRQHEARYAEDSSELVPMYFLYKGDHVHAIAATPLSGARGEKEAVVRQIRKMADEAGCDAYTFSSEAWTLPPELAKHHDGSSLQNHPSRVEILSVEAGVSCGTNGILVAELHRTGEQVTLQLREPLVSDDKNGALSRFNIFSPATDRMLNALRQSVQTTTH